MKRSFRLSRKLDRYISSVLKIRVENEHGSFRRTAFAVNSSEVGGLHEVIKIALQKAFCHVTRVNTILSIHMVFESRIENATGRYSFLIKQLVQFY